MTFDEFNLDRNLLDGLHSMRFDQATPIQEAAIPVILEGKDIIACAQTGTGKTAAYLIPIMQRIMQLPDGHTRALVLAPTRELAQQIDQNFQAIGYFTGVTSVAIFGGKDSKGWDSQKNAIENGVDVMIATPGRFHLHNTLGYMDLSGVEIVVLDEADKMLDMGFHADIIKIIEQLPQKRQTVMFSATMPKKIRQLAHEIQQNPVEVNFNLAKPAAGIDQKAYCVYDEQKLPLLKHLIKEKDIDSMIIFASSKLKVDEIDRELRKQGVNVRAMHSDKEQEERTETLQQFKAKQFPIIVGTDVLARGIDIDNLSHVLNFDCPRDAEDYVHRVGRTARASKTGEAITFVNPRDFRRLANIERLIESEIPKPPIPSFLGDTPTYSATASHSYEDRGPKRNGRGSSKPRSSAPRSGSTSSYAPSQGATPTQVPTQDGEVRKRKRGGRRRPKGPNSPNGSGPSRTES